MGIIQDIRFGIRMLGKNPGFTAVAVLTLALGMGVNTIVFTIVNAVFLNGLPFHDPQEIVDIRSDRGNSYADYLDYRAQVRSLRGIAALSNLPADLSDSEGAAERVNGSAFSSNMFALLGQKPQKGRDFTPEDEKVGAQPVAVISHSLWQSRYNGDPNVLGRQIRVNLHSYTVVGVMPEGESFPQNTKLWIPLLQDETRRQRDQRNINIIGRLADASSLSQAQAEFRTISAQLAQVYPETNKDIEAHVDSYTSRSTGGPIRVVLFAMQGAVTFVLMIACASVANLLLARAVGRTRESAIRSALGAGRWRVVRQLLVESVMMSTIGGLLGLGLAWFGVKWFDSAVIDTGKPYWIVFRFDPHVFLYFMTICVLTGVLFGLAPALQISKANINAHLREGSRGSSMGTQSRRLIGSLLIAEISLTIVLLVGAGLMIRSFLNSQRFEIGVNTDNLLTVQIQPTANKYPLAADRYSFEERLLQRLDGLPGVDMVVIASHPPAGGAGGRTVKIEGREMADKDGRLPVWGRVTIGPDYFHKLNLNLIRGRNFTAADGIEGSEVAIVNQPFADKYFPNEDPLGKRIKLGDDLDRGVEDPKGVWLSIVGVSPPVFQDSRNDRFIVDPTLYLPLRQDPPQAFTVIARARMEQGLVITAIRNELRGIDPDLPLYNIRSLDQILEQQRWPFLVFGTLFAVFALIALVISSVGIYAVTAYGVGQRTAEIGIRMALGASSRDVLWLVLRQGLVRIVIGLAIGLIGAFGLSRVLSSILVNLSPTDPLTFASITLILTTVTVLACLIPALRAKRLDPVEALRNN